MKTFKQFYNEGSLQTMGKDLLRTHASEELSAALTIMKTLEEYAGCEVLIVGGAVRDMMMGKTPHDLDLATNLDLDRAEDILKDTLQASIHDIGNNSKDFGVINIIYKNQHFELAHYRQETGERSTADVDLIDDFIKDSNRRDITINSMGINREGEIFDPNGGIDDIENKRIRAVGNPRDRMMEDPLRMLRAVRFAAKFDFTIDDSLKSAISELGGTVFRDNESGSEGVSAERLGMELWKAASISGPALANYIEQLNDNGLLEKFLPEIHRMPEFDQDPEHHPEGNVYIHTIEVLKASDVTDNPVALLATLFHDVGKPNTYEFKPTKSRPEGKHTYHRHEQEGETVWYDIATRLKLPNSVKKVIGWVIRRHMMLYGVLKKDKPSVQKLVNLKTVPDATVDYAGETHTINFYETLLAVLRADIGGRPAPEGLEHSARTSDDYNTITQHVDRETKKFGDEREINNKLKAIIGGDKIRLWTNLPPGPVYSKIINAVKEWVFNSHPTGEPSEEEVREFVLDYVKSA